MPFLKIHAKNSKVLGIVDEIPKNWGSIAAFRWVAVPQETADSLEKKDIRRGRYKIGAAAFTQTEIDRMNLLNAYHDKKRSDWDNLAKKRKDHFEAVNGRPPGPAEVAEIERKIELDDLVVAQAVVEIMEIPPSILEPHDLGANLEETPEDEWEHEYDLDPDGDPIVFI